MNDNLLHIHSDVLSEHEGLWDVVDPGVSGSARVETSMSCVDILYHQSGVCVCVRFIIKFVHVHVHVNERCRRKKEARKGKQTTRQSNTCTCI